MAATDKPNSIRSTGDFGGAQPEATGWNTAAPTSDNDVTIDPYSAPMLGPALGDGNGDGGGHNSEWLTPTPMD